MVEIYNKMITGESCSDLDYLGKFLYEYNNTYLCYFSTQPIHADYSTLNEKS